MSSPSRPTLDALVERCILALEQGDQAAIDRIASEHPDEAPALRERLAHLQSLGILDAPKPEPSVPERLGEFRLLRQIGRGGMGVVYLAEQAALQRQVALKLVHPQQLFFAGARERFRREILAVARLQHPGIVPILTCGEADDIPYFAMELVAGASLAEIVHELAGNAPATLDGPALRSALQRAMARKHVLAAVADAPVFAGAWSAVVARLVLAAAQALQHAHAQGVLHRDVKPSNLLLAADGAVRIIDFGLASAEGEQRLTRSGATFGSLPYMAPEQVRGDVAEIDARTDVYGLGVALYELLTLALPHGDGSRDTRERILAGQVVPPSRTNPTVHPDLDAICLTAMACEPGRRYAAVAALAADLTAFLEQRTVSARRPSLMLRSRRWVRRSPARAASVAALFVVLVPGPLVFAWQQHAAAGRIQVALDAEARQRTAAEASLGRALDAVDLMLLRTSEARLADHPRTAKLRRQLLEDAITLQQQLIATTGEAALDDLRARGDLARARARLGGLLFDVGKYGESIDVLRKAIAALEDLRPQVTDRGRLLRELATAWERLSQALGQSDRLEENLVATQHAFEVFRDLRRCGGEHTGVGAKGEARALIGRATSFGAASRTPEALAQLDEIDTLLAPDGDLTRDLSSVDRLELWALVADHRGVALAVGGESDRAFHAFAEALRRLDSAPAESADAAPIAQARLGVLERLGLITHQRYQFEQAAPFLDRACAGYEAMVAKEPDFIDWRSKLARILGTRADNRRRLDDGAGALADHDRAIGLLEAICKEAPEARTHRDQLAIAYGERALALATDGDLDRARPDFARSEELFALGIDDPTTPQQSRNNFAATLANHANAEAEAGELAAAIALAERGVALLRSHANSESQASLVEMMSMVSDLTLRNGDPTGARRWMDDAATCARELLAARPGDSARQRVVARLAINHGILLVNLGDLPAAKAVWEAALPAGRAGAKDSGFGRLTLAFLLLRLADAARRDGDAAAMRQWFQAARDETGVRQEQVARYPQLATLFAEQTLQDLVPKPGGR